ncbi:hypothetical protein AAMO2058_000217000 [Amorphochlora amoebiformis]
MNVSRIRGLESQTSNVSPSCVWSLWLVASSASPDLSIPPPHNPSPEPNLLESRRSRNSGISAIMSSYASWTTMLNADESTPNPTDTYTTHFKGQKPRILKLDATPLVPGVTFPRVKQPPSLEVVSKAQKVESSEQGSSSEAKAAPKAESEKSKAPAWIGLNGTSFQVRMGPDYAKNKKKAASKESFYECVGIDCLASPRKISNIGRYFYPSDGQEKKSTSKKNPFPEIFIFALQLPDYAPSMMSSQGDGAGYTIVFHYKLTEKGRKQIQESKLPAAKVLRKFVKAVRIGGGPQKTEHSMYLRPKVIMRLMNHEELGLGFVHRKLCENFNAKPFLSRPEHTLHLGGGESSKHYLEIDVDVHRFKYFQRRCAHSFRDKFCKAEIDIGIVIESHGNQEMPEQMLGACRIERLPHHTFTLVAEEGREEPPTPPSRSPSKRTERPRKEPPPPGSAPPPPPPGKNGDNGDKGYVTGMGESLGLW